MFYEFLIDSVTEFKLQKDTLRTEIGSGRKNNTTLKIIQTSMNSYSILLHKVMLKNIHGNICLEKISIKI